MAASDASFDIARLETRDIAHIGYVVPQMERALATWQRSGAELIIPPALDPIQNVMCALLILAGTVPVELVAPMPEGPNPVATRLAKGGGIDHVCIYADDVAAAFAVQLEQKAMGVVEPHYGAVFDRDIAFVVTRGGLVLELMQKKAQGKLAADPLARIIGNFAPGR
jgi:methylmalonyl-CoA/ethylmalonyl-CoA epimerase